MTTDAEPTAGLLVVRAGVHDTVQDLGRAGQRRYGVTGSGALDAYAHRAANLLLDNDAAAATLEMTLVAATLRFTAPTLMALTGADLGFTLNGQPVGMWQTHVVQAGDELTGTGRRRGCRAYLGIAGGIRTPVALGARATWSGAGIGGLDGRTLRAGDLLPILATSPREAAVARRRLPRSCRGSQPSHL